MSSSPVFLSETLRADGSLDTRVLAEILQISEFDLLVSIGVFGGGDAQDVGLQPCVKEARMSALLRILERVSPWAGSPRAAFDWYCTQAISSLGGRTAQDLVSAGRMDAVESYLQRINHGGYA